METIEKVRNELIDKIIAINNKSYLEALDNLITKTTSQSELVELSTEQKMMLEMSEDDIKNWRLISQEALEKRNLEWLNAM